MSNDAGRPAPGPSTFPDTAFTGASPAARPARRAADIAGVKNQIDTAQGLQGALAHQAGYRR